jgi:hypothetical protein
MLNLPVEDNSNIDVAAQELPVQYFQGRRP